MEGRNIGVYLIHFAWGGGKNREKRGGKGVGEGRGGRER